MKKTCNRLLWPAVYLFACCWPINALARNMTPSSSAAMPAKGWLVAFSLVVLSLLLAVLRLKWISMRAIRDLRKSADPELLLPRQNIWDEFNSDQLGRLIHWYRRKQNAPNNLSRGSKSATLLLLPLLAAVSGLAQGNAPVQASLLSETGIVITIVLILIPILAGIVLLIVKVLGQFRRLRLQAQAKEADVLARYLANLEPQQTLPLLEAERNGRNFQLRNAELTGHESPSDPRRLIRHIKSAVDLPLVKVKKKASPRPSIDPALSRLLLWYFGTAAFWLIFGTTVGEYLGIKFMAPDLDQLAALSFGRLRPVHTNAVFWGWASLAMLGLGHYAVPRVSNTRLASYRLGWYSLGLINATVLAGTILLMAGINNGGGEYREYIWPVMLLFALALVLILVNFIKTISRRTTKEIYISNWYIVSAIMFALVIVLVAYLPMWQNGLGETIVQGYYMHQGVGMWFMLFTLGVVYYFLPQQLNKPIYSYSLGILAFWTQILFYTLIGTHHFVFSSIPWWLQTVAIVGSAGMVIPVVAGTTNFLLTFKGAWHAVRDSYTLPFFLVGIVFYFTGSLQGTAEAFRTTNLIWHFTDFTVAHSHLTMYGIISFFMWAGIYAVTPRLTGQEPPQLTVGIHFWLALVGLLFYTIPLMYGSTLKGLLWLQGRPFIEGVTLMKPYWLWRAIGGSLMWASHLVFAYNLYRMLIPAHDLDVQTEALRILEQQSITATAETA